MGGETHMFGGVGGYTAVCITLMMMEACILLYHVASNAKHVPNRTQTWGPATQAARNRQAAAGGAAESTIATTAQDMSMTTTVLSGPSRTANARSLATQQQDSKTRAVSVGGGTGSAQQLICGNFKLTPNNTSTTFMAMNVGSLFFTILYVWPPATEDEHACEIISGLHYSLNILSRIAQYAFVMMRVRVTAVTFTPLQKKVAKALWWWFGCGFFGVFIATLVVDNAHLKVDDDGNRICVDSQREGDYGNFVMGWVFGFFDATTQTVALVLFVLPMRKYIRAKQGTSVSGPAKQVLNMVRKVMRWTIVMVVSTAAASIFYIVTNNSFMFSVDVVINSICITKQYLRRRSCFAGPATSAEDDQVAADIDAGAYGLMERDEVESSRAVSMQTQIEIGAQSPDADAGAEE